MSNKIHSIQDFDLFYLSYDEPDKEEKWAAIQSLMPWAQRVDGVKGFDAAHKACANASATEHFFTIDGDNNVFEDFLTLQFQLPAQFADCTLSWAARNVINGLTYGNGGIKLWSKDFALGMRTHEDAATEAEKLDFCWDKRYIPLSKVYCTTAPNASPFQAFRAGFREGVKMSLDQGNPVTGKLFDSLYRGNYYRLLVWCSVGADVKNGLWAMYGARMGCALTVGLDDAFKLSNISDYEWFKTQFDESVAPRFVGEMTHCCEYTGQTWDINLLQEQVTALGQFLKKKADLPLVDISPEQSSFMKQVYSVSLARLPEKYEPLIMVKS